MPTGKDARRRKSASHEYCDFIVPIPGMHIESRITENLGAADIELTNEEYTALTAALNKIEIHGDRDGKDIAKLGTVPDNVAR